MPTLTHKTIIEIDLGGEALRVSQSRELIVGSMKHDLLVEVEEDGGEATLYSRNASPLGGFGYMAIIVDPDGQFQDGDEARELTVQITGTDGASVAFNVRGETPLVLGAEDIGVDADNLDEAVLTISALNANPVGDPAGSNNVFVRCLLFGAPE